MVTLGIVAGAVLGLAFLVVGLLVGRVALRFYGRAYRQATVDEYDPLSVPAGETVAVQGTVRPADGTDPVRGALGDPGVLVNTEIARWRRGSKRAGSSRGWDTFHWHYQGVPFYLEDGSGAVRVVPPDEPEDTRSVPVPEFDLPMETRRSSDETPPPEPLVSYAESVGGLRYGPADRRLEVRETVVQPGDEVWVLGETADRLTPRGQEVVVAGDEHPGTFTVSTPGGGSPTKNFLYGLFMTWFSLAGIGGGLLVLLVMLPKALS